MKRGAFGSSSSFFLSDEMCTSMDRSQASKSRSAAASSNCSRLRTRPGAAISASNRSNSTFVRTNGALSKVAMRAAGSSHSGPRDRGAGVASARPAAVIYDRRNTDRKRAISSRVENVFGR